MEHSSTDISSPKSIPSPETRQPNFSPTSTRLYEVTLIPGRITKEMIWAGLRLMPAFQGVEYFNRVAGPHNAEVIQQLGLESRTARAAP